MVGTTRECQYQEASGEGFTWLTHDLPTPDPPLSPGRGSIGIIEIQRAAS